MALSTTEKKIAVIVHVDAKKAVDNFRQYRQAADDAKKSTAKLGEGLDVLHAREQNAREALAKMKAESDKLSKGQAELAKATQETIGKLIGMASKAAVAAAAIAGLAVAANAFATESLRTEGLFTNLTVSLDQARASTQGMIDDMTLASAASRSVQLGAAKTSEEFATLAKGGQLMANVLGTDAAGAIEDISVALARQSPMILDNIGVSLKVGDAHKEYAKSIGKTVDQLGDAEKAEAFRVVALARIAEKTKDVKLATDDWRGSVVKARVEVENLRTAMLGGEQGARQFEMSLVELTKKGVIDANDNILVYGDDLEKIKDALIEMGHSTSAVAKVTATELAPGVKKARIEVERLAAAEAAAAAEAERLRKAARFQAEFDASISDAVFELDKELVLLKNMGGAEAEIEERQRARVRLLIAEATQRADILEVVKLIRAEEMRQLEDATAPGKSGGRGDRFKRERAAFEAELAAMNRAKGFAQLDRSTDTARRTFDGSLNEARSALEFKTAAAALGEARRADIAQHLAEEQSRNDALFDQQRRAREIAVAEGLDPAEGMRREHVARVEFQAQELALLQQHGASKEAIADAEQQLAEAQHRQTIARLAAEEAARKKHLATILQVNRVVGQSGREAIGLAGEVAEATARSEKDKEAARRLAGAGTIFVTGVEQQVEAIAAFAALNPIQGAMHQSAAAFAFARAAMLGGGIIGGGAGGAGAGAGGGQSSSFRPAGMGGDKRDRIESGPPVSRASAHAGPKTSGGAKGPAVVQNFYSWLPAEEKQMGMTLRKALKHSEQDDGGI